MNKTLAWTVACGVSLVVCHGQAADVELTWDAPTQNEDGTPLTDLSGYKVYWGFESGVYVNTRDVGYVTSHTLLGLQDNTPHYFTATAYDTSGNESQYAAEVSWSGSDTIAPGAPTNLRAVWQRILSWLKRQNRQSGVNNLRVS